eukprot:11770110-Alexandrium_andersonii.AAC.1
MGSAPTGRGMGSVGRPGGIDAALRALPAAGSPPGRRVAAPPASPSRAGPSAAAAGAVSPAAHTPRGRAAEWRRER